MASPTCEGHAEYVTRLGDSALVLSQRLSEWVGSAPTLEEEVALANIALDLLGQATMLLDHAGELEGAGRRADDMAYGRDAREWRNLLLCERPNGDFAQTIVRQLLYEAYAHGLWSSLAHSSDEQLAGIAAKALKETRYHLRHVGEWFIRLADGTDESRARTERAIAELWPYAGEAFAADEVDEAVERAGIAPSCAHLRDEWFEVVSGAAAEAGVALPALDESYQRGGKHGLHTEALGYLLAEMQVLQRTYPGATW